MKFSLFPIPRKTSFFDSRVDLRDAQWISLDPALSASFTNRVIAMARRLDVFFARPLAVADDTSGTGRVFCSVSLVKNGLRPQEYRLTVDAGGAKLEAAGEAGLFYGLTTLEQLVAQTQAVVPACFIEDYPDFAARGVMLDVSRCKVPTMDTMYAYVDLLAKLKINQLQLYMEHAFAYSAHETVWR
jgi:hexosaminidase